MPVTFNRNSRGSLVSVTVPMLVESDPQWYKRAAAAAGIGYASTYTIAANRFLTRGNGNAKILKSDKSSRRFLSAIRHLAPHQMSGKQLCPMAKACARVCVTYNGKGQMSNDGFESRGETIGKQSFLVRNIATALTHNVHAARIAKARLFNQNRDLFFECLFDDLSRFARSAARQDLTPLVRLNGTSDIPFESLTIERLAHQTIFNALPGIQFYDYTKIGKRFLNTLPSNYDLTFSRDESNSQQCADILKRGGRVAAVIRTEAMRTSWGKPLAILGKQAIGQAIKNGIAEFDGVRVVDGDKSDLRHLDPLPSVVALYAKGRAARDDSGFVVTI